MNPAPQQALEAVGRARNTELAVRIGNKARAALAHERTALAALAAADAGASYRAIGAKLGISHVAATHWSTATSTKTCTTRSCSAALSSSHPDGVPWRTRRRCPPAAAPDEAAAAVEDRLPETLMTTQPWR